MSTEAIPLIRSLGRAEEDPRRGLAHRIVPVIALSRVAVEEMLRLFRAHFQVLNPDAFLRDLGRKQFVIQLLDEEDRLQGFSTITSFRTSFRGRDVGVVYSGDTIIHPEFWGSSVLPKAWLQVVVEMAPALPRPLYWLLLSSGYKTYRMLPVFFREFHPRFDKDTPEAALGLMGHLAHLIAGAQFDPRKGIIRFACGATPLRPGVAEPDEQHLRDPHTAYFLKRNPGHRWGDELVCLAEVADGNLSGGGRRILRALGRETLG
ncbi:MAG: hypothetical protein ACWGSQ_14970 [Longimicrobiales bacterium]